MSPIFVRPVREQLEHDRLIRHLQIKYKRKFEVAANVGDEQVAPVKIGTNTFFPDLVLTANNKLAGLVEVESGESVNNLEALAQWVHFARAKVPFHLYVPVHVYDSARRLCDSNHARVTEIWTYRAAADGFDLVRIHLDASASVATTRSTETRAAPANGGKAAAAAAPKATPKAAPKPAPKPAPKAVPKPEPKAAPKTEPKVAKAKPAKPPAPAPKARKKPAARPVRQSKPAARSKRR